MRFIGLLHALVLCLITYATLRPLRLNRAAAVTAAMILLWTNLVLTAQILSVFSGLGSVWAFLALSVALAVGMCFFVGWLELGAAAPVRSFQVDAPKFPFEDWFVRGLLLSGAVVLLLNLIIATTHLASNPDTIVYRFPRVYWYLTQGSFAHVANGTDPRVTYYPTNGTVLYMPLVLYRLGALWFNLPTLLAWCVIPLTTYAFARHLGAARLWAVAASWAVALTPNVLIQALSTNDEILAAASMLAGLFFLHRWMLAGRPLDLLLGAAGVCLSVGTKLHVFFYWPYLLLLAVVSLFGWRRVLALLTGLANARGAAVLLSCVALVVAFVLSFIIHNIRASGQLTDYAFARLVLNTPFNPLVAIQTIAVYAAQIALSPFPDILPNAGYSGARIPHYMAFNALFQPLFGWVDNGPAFTSVGYRFTGIVSNSAFLLNEQTVMLGFSWIAVLVATAWLATHRNQASPWALWLSVAFPAWFLGWAASTKYIEGIPVYIAYAAVISSPSWAFALGPIASTFWSRVRWFAIFLIGVTHILTAVSVLTLNTSRSAAATLSGKFKLPRSVTFTVDQSVTDELLLAKAGITNHTIDWGQPNWVFMAFNPQIPQKLSTSGFPDPAGNIADPTLHVFPIRQFPAFGHAAMKITRKTTPGLTKIGELLFALGPEWVFAIGNGVETRHFGATGYIVFTFNEVSDFGHDSKPFLDVQPRVLGLGGGDDLSFRHILKVDGHVVDRTDWAQTPGARLSTAGMNADNGVLTIEVRNNKADGHIDSIDVRLRSAKPPVPVP
ncbi:hypothetical protein AB4Z40_32500 [Bosea sp. 2YAB26]|uniref:hypothetical protein n=1 Tax=Bosea sp. 2YAB26 TaxID=3237478 RepID=UPI003F91F026